MTPRRAAYEKRKNSLGLTDELVLEMRQYRASGASLRDVSARYGICISTLSGILTGTRWAHVPGAVYVRRRRCEH